MRQIPCRFSAFSKRATKEFGEWKEKIMENQCFEKPRKFVMQLLEAFHDFIRKMQEIAIPTPGCDIESCYDKVMWEDIEEEYANKVILKFAST